MEQMADEPELRDPADEEETQFHHAMIQVGQGMWERYLQYHTQEGGIVVKSVRNEDGTPVIPSKFELLEKDEDIDAAVLAWVDELLGKFYGEP
jgi:hypothetical protein